MNTETRQGVISGSRAFLQAFFEKAALDLLIKNTLHYQ
jgi:hypothetical protein